jgi:hypothetical protein
VVIDNENTPGLRSTPAMTDNRPSRRWIGRGAALAAVAGGLAVAPATAARAVPAQPVPAVCTPTAVGSAEIVRTTTGPGILVRGVAAGPRIGLRLEPEHIDFVRQPDYWPYVVVDCIPDAAPVRTRYSMVFAVPTAPIGRSGIEIGPDQINL